MVYKGITIAEDYKVTSQNPGKCHSVAGTVTKTRSLEEVLSYDNQEIVYRISKDLKISLEDASTIFTDLKKFLWVASKSEKETIPPPLIDEAWHSFILFTQDYHSFCMEHFGEFLHHIPHRSTDDELPMKQIQESIDLFQKLLGEESVNGNWHYVNLIHQN